MEGLKELWNEVRFRTMSKCLLYSKFEAGFQPTQTLHWRGAKLSDLYLRTIIGHA